MSELKDLIQKNLNIIRSKEASRGTTLGTADFHLICNSLNEFIVSTDGKQILDELAEASMKEIYHFMETGELPNRGKNELQKLKRALGELCSSWQMEAVKLPISNEIRHTLFKCAGDVLKIIS